MSEKTENHTIRLLKELRGDIQAMRGSVDHLSTRVDGLTLMFGTVMGYIQQHDERITTLEDTVK